MVWVLVVMQTNQEICLLEWKIKLEWSVIAKHVTKRKSKHNKGTQTKTTNKIAQQQIQKHVNTNPSQKGLIFTDHHMLGSDWLQETTEKRKAGGCLR